MRESRLRSIACATALLPSPCGVRAAAYDDGMSNSLPTRVFDHIQLLRYTGLFTWFCVGIPLMRRETILNQMAEIGRSPASYDWWVVCYLLFGVVFWFLTHDMGKRDPTRFRRFAQIVLLLLLNFCALAIGWLSQSGISALLLVVVSVALPWTLPLRVGVAWMVLQNFSLLPIFAGSPGFTLGDAVLQSSLYLGSSAIAFVASLVARQQTEAREAQRRLNSELRATRALLAESSRLGERMRISRDLHDLMGHHLTALSLNLEVATHLSSDPAVVHVRQAQTVAKLLLSDVREVVSQLRESDSIDLSEALASLIEGVPGLDIELDLPEQFSVGDPRRAQVLLRCAQEVITNTVRHAAASNLVLSFERDGTRNVIMRACDDGHGADELSSGNGLNGMRERLAEFGGQLDIVTGKGQGFSLSITLPAEGMT